MKASIVRPILFFLATNGIGPAVSRSASKFRNLQDLDVVDELLIDRDAGASISSKSQPTISIKPTVSSMPSQRSWAISNSTETLFLQQFIVEVGKEFTPDQLQLLKLVYELFTPNFAPHADSNTMVTSTFTVHKQSLHSEEIGLNGSVQSLNLIYAMNYESIYYNVTTYPMLFQNWTTNNPDIILKKLQTLSFNVTEVKHPQRIVLSTPAPTISPAPTVSPEPTLASNSDPLLRNNSDTYELYSNATNPNSDPLLRNNSDFFESDSNFENPSSESTSVTETTFAPSESNSMEDPTPYLTYLGIMVPVAVIVVALMFALDVRIYYESLRIRQNNNNHRTDTVKSKELDKGDEESPPPPPPTRSGFSPRYASNGTMATSMSTIVYG